MNNRNTEENPPPPPPLMGLNQTDLMAIATIVATTMQGMVNPAATVNQPQTENQHRRIKYDYESLRKNRAPVFKGDSSPEAGKSWLKGIETQLQLLEMPNEFKISVVTPFLEDKAAKWWETVSPALSVKGPITWPQFREEFLKQYYPTEVRLQKIE